ncbi:TIGR02391 family protein [Actinomadura parmotrematis]|uniref:TIGR02391 family protein n=1 Tax=Actinomadura parmotrematis TaxID=2864039 RepID=A0ABS7FQD4_9ACTN|nr:TIGR02391 family protein [Actinomadura parmotrematis]MBW8482613.1 TIGR02391 family protein [Actinomadura parmotrematis]
MNNQSWELSPEEVLTLPLDELALHVLRDAKINGEWNWGNWLISAKQGYGRRPDVLGALSEAWGWLQTHGLIAWNPGQSAQQAFVISRRGEQLLNLGLTWLRAVQRLDIEMLPVLEQKVRPQFMRGDFEIAAFTAMREVEVQVRQRAGFGNDQYGVRLMQLAFAADPPGPLSHTDVEKSERVATMELFKGAIGVFKNPPSHRQVDFDDPTEAAEIILFADLLLRLLDKTPDHSSNTP